jgi:hypothetical protein
MAISSSSKTIAQIAFWVFIVMGCTSDNPEPTGTFSASLSGNFTSNLEGTARFRLEPSGINGIVIIQLKESDDVFVRLSFPNSSPSQIFLEPDTYSIVPQLGNDLTSEVLVDFINNGISYTARGGEIAIGISKPDQISGEIVSAEFDVLKSMCNGQFDAIPE